MYTWDKVIDTLGSWEKTTAKATLLLAEGKTELACMMLRDVLLATWNKENKFQHSDEFIKICRNPLLLAYLFPASTVESLVTDLTKH